MSAERKMLMKVDAMQRRIFLGSAGGTLGLLAMTGGTAVLSATEATKGKKVSPDLQAARDKLLPAMEANRGIAVPPMDGDFLYLQVHVTNAKNVLEVGTFRGYSAIRMGLGLEQTGGRLTTIDIDPVPRPRGQGQFREGRADRSNHCPGGGCP